MERSYDVIVAGGGPSGLCAAVAAARNGARVLLVERYGFIGGNATVSLVGPWMTFHSTPAEQVVAGLAEEIVQRLTQVGGTLGHVRDTTGYVATLTPFDAETLKFVAFELCAEAGVELLLHTFIADVLRDGNRVTGIVAVNKSGRMELRAPVVIDCTGDGDVATLAGATFEQGRAEDGLTQPMTMMFKMAGVDLGKVRTYMKEHPSEFYKRTLVDDLDHLSHLSVNGFYSIMEDAMRKGELNLKRDLVLFFQTVHDDEVTVNMTRVQGLDGTDTWQLTQAEIELRRQVMQLVRFFRSHVPGFEKAYLSATGTAGVRETRRIMGDYVLTAEDLIEGRHFPDIISRYAYPIDIHSPSGDGVKTVRMRSQSYEIPFRSLLPRDLEGILVAGRCISCTHEALAAIRTMPGAMALGQASGTAAALAVKARKGLRELDMAGLQATLRAQGANLDHAPQALNDDAEVEPSGKATAGGTNP